MTDYRESTTIVRVRCAAPSFDDRCNCVHHKATGKYSPCRYLVSEPRQFDTEYDYYCMWPQEPAEFTVVGYVR